MSELEAVYVVRRFNNKMKCLAIYGVYKTEATAIKDLEEEYPNLIFDDEYWIYRDADSGFFYRIDAFTLK